MKLTSFIYQSLIKFYQIVPFKQTVCELLRASGVDHKKFYKDVQFEGAFEVKVEDKIFKLIHHKSTIENEIFWNGLGKSFEEDTIWVWIELCKEANIVFDIGANTGVYSLITKALNPKATVYAFEPVQRTFSWFKKNLALNNYDVNTEMIALSNINGTQVFYDTPQVTQTSASLSPDKLKNFSGYEADVVEYNITTATMDKFIKEHGINHIDLIKIDVELHEPEVIEGFMQHLHVFKPSIVIEVLSEEVANKINTFLAQGTYRIFHLAGKGKMVEKKKIEVEYPYWNYLLCQSNVADKLSQYIS